MHLVEGRGSQTFSHLDGSLIPEPLPKISFPLVDVTNFYLDQSVVNLISAPDLEFEGVSLLALTAIFLPLPVPACHGASSP